MSEPKVHPLTPVLVLAWAKYTELFGEPPHGTDKQLAALLELAKFSVSSEPTETCGCKHGENGCDTSACRYPALKAERDRLQRAIGEHTIRTARIIESVNAEKAALQATHDEAVRKLSTLSDKYQKLSEEFIVKDYQLAEAVRKIRNIADAIVEDWSQRNRGFRQGLRVALSALGVEEEPDGKAEG